MSGRLPDFENRKAEVEYDSASNRTLQGMRAESPAKKSVRERLRYVRLVEQDEHTGQRHDFSPPGSEKADGVPLRIYSRRGRRPKGDVFFPRLRPGGDGLQIRNVLRFVFLTERRAPPGKRGVIMSALLIATSIASLWLASGDGDDLPAAELDRLKGEWMLLQPVAGVVPDRPDPRAQANWKFEKNGDISFWYALHLRSFDDTEYGRYARCRLDPTKEKKQIDLTFKEGNWAGKTMLGIYTVTGDVLIIALSSREGERAADFTSAPGSRRLLVFRRAAEK
jgi:uncharacterized protein (TIGR03067 family)